MPMACAGPTYMSLTKGSRPQNQNSITNNKQTKNENPSPYTKKTRIYQNSLNAPLR